MNADSIGVAGSPGALARAVGALLVALLAFAGPARAQPEGIADLVRDLTVLVREREVQSDQEVSRGCGLVVGWDDQTLTILTAGHVVGHAADGSGGFVVEVLYSGGSAWKGATLGPAIGGADQMDAAYVTVQRQEAPFAGPPPVERLSTSPAPRSGERVWAYGHGPKEGVLSWQKGQMRARTGTEVTFDSEGVVGGFSGGVLATEQGIVGMTVEVAPDGVNDVALAIEPLLERIRAAGGAARLKQSPVRAALRNTLDRGLAAAMDVWDFEANKAHGMTFWSALVAQSADGNTFTMEAISQRRVACRIECRPDGATLTTPELVRGDGSGGRLPAGTVDLKVDPTVALPGFVVLKGESGNRTVYVAIPTGNCELLAARALVNHAMPGTGAILDTAHRRMLNATGDRRSQLRLTPFSVCLGRATAMTMSLSLEQHGDKPVTVMGRFVLPDVMRNDTPVDQERARKVLAGLRLELVDQGQGDRVMGSVQVPWGEEELTMQFGAPSGVVQIRHSEVDNEARAFHGATGAMVLIQGLRVEYQR